MGLDGVEFIMTTETAFGVEIADADVEKITTPRELIAHLRTLLPHADSSPCLTQQAFYHVRSRVAAEMGVPRRAICPSTAIESVVPGMLRKDAWRTWGHSLGAEGWTALPGAGWFGRRKPDSPATFGDVARHLAVYGPSAVKRGGGWTDAEIESCLVALIVTDLGIDMKRYTIDSRFVQDLGID